MPVVAQAADSEQPYACNGGHGQGDERIDRVPPSLEPAGLVFEADPNAPGYHGSPLKFTNLEDFDFEIDAEADPTALAAVTRVLSRQETMSNPSARAAVRKEAEGLVQKRTWNWTRSPSEMTSSPGPRKRGLKYTWAN